MGVEWVAILGFVASFAVGCGVVVRRTRHLPGPAVACGGCGHLAADLAGFACPECRCDVRAVGLVVPPSDRQRLFARVVLALLVTVVATTAVAMATDGQAGAVTSVVFRRAEGHPDSWPANSDPGLPPISTVRFHGIVLRPADGGRTTGEFDAAIYLADGRCFAADVDLPSLGWRSTDDQTREQAAPFDAAAVERWLVTSNFPGTPEQCRSVAATIRRWAVSDLEVQVPPPPRGATLGRDAVFHVWSSTGGGDSIRSLRPRAWVLATAAGAWPLAVLVIVRRPRPRVDRREAA